MGFNRKLNQSATQGHLDADMLKYLDKHGAPLDKPKGVKSIASTGRGPMRRKVITPSPAE